MQIHTQVRSVHTGTHVSWPQEIKACYQLSGEVMVTWQGPAVRLGTWKFDLELKKNCLHSEPTCTPS